MSRGWQQSCTELSTVMLGESLIQRLARGRRLYNMPQTKLLTRCHTTVRVQLWCSMSSLSGTKQTRLTLEDWYEKNATLYSDGELAWKTQRQEHSEYELWYSFPSESAFTAINTVLRGLMWLIFGFFSTQAFVARFTAQKLLWCHSAFYIATSSVQSWRHALLCFLLLLTEETHNHKKHTHTHTPTMSPLGTGVCPSSVRAEDEQCCYSKPSKSKIRIHILTMTPFRIKEGHTGKTGSIITTQSTLGTVISPGALKGWTKHL